MLQDRHLREDMRRTILLQNPLRIRPREPLKRNPLGQPILLQLVPDPKVIEGPSMVPTLSARLARVC